MFIAILFLLSIGNMCMVKFDRRVHEPIKTSSIFIYHTAQAQHTQTQQTDSHGTQIFELENAIERIHRILLTIFVCVCVCRWQKH